MSDQPLVLSPEEKAEFDCLMWWSRHYNEGRQYELCRAINRDLHQLMERVRARQAAS